MENCGRSRKLVHYHRPTSNPRMHPNLFGCGEAGADTQVSVPPLQHHPRSHQRPDMHLSQQPGIHPTKQVPAYRRPQTRESIQRDRFRDRITPPPPLEPISGFIAVPDQGVSQPCTFSADELVDTIDIGMCHDLRPRCIWQTIIASETYNVLNYCLV